jgi:hypothetical protein
MAAALQGDLAMSDLATLGMKFVTEGADQANRQLDQVAEKSAKAERATDALSGAQRRNGGAIAQMLRSIERAVVEQNEMTKGFLAGAAAAIQEAREVERASASISRMPAIHGRAIGSSRALTGATLNLTRQFADVGVSAAMGIAPLMIFIQQAPQIADAFAVAKMQGLGFSAVLRGIAAEAAPVVIALAPLVALAAAAAAGFALLNRELSKGYPKDITEGLGFTEDQLKRVESRTVTLGDTWKATLDVMGKYLRSGPIGDGLDWLDKRLAEFLDMTAKAFFEGTALIVGSFLGAYRTIVANWRNFPSALADVATMAWNGVLDAVQKGVNGVIMAMNLAIKGAAFINPAFRMIPEIPQADLSRFKGQISGAASFIADSFGANVDQAIKDVKGGMRAIGAEIRAGAIKNAQDRARTEAGDPKTVGDAAHKAAKEVDEFAEELKRLHAWMEQTTRDADAWARAIANIKPIDMDLNAALFDSDKLESDLKRVRELGDQLRDVGFTIADGFGKAGQAVDRLIGANQTFAEQQAQIAYDRVQAEIKYRNAVKAAADNKDPAAKYRAEIQFEREREDARRQSSAAEVRRNIAELDAVKSLFSRKSAAYKALTAIEVAYQAIHIAGTLKAMAIDVIHTAKSIANSGLRATADGVAAIAKAIASLPFPLNLAAGAATAAALVAFGVKVFGGGGGGGASIPTAEERQASQGTGSVLGDATAKSDSIAKSLTLVEQHTNKDLEYSNSMLKALRSIDNSIGAVAAALGRAIGAGGSLDTSRLGLGTTSSGPSTLTKLFNPIAAILPGLFGKKVTKTLTDQGLAFNPGSLEDILNGGISGSTYQDVATKTKKKFLGITTSNKTKTNTVTGDLDAELATQIGLLIGSLRDGVLAAATVLGVEGADKTLDAFQVELGKISLKDLKPDEIEATLNAVFSKLGDDLAGSVVPALKEFQKAGEGLFETLNRVARDYQVVDVSLQSIGKTFGAVGLASIGAREHLIELFGSLDTFTEQTQFFADNFLSDIERLAPIQAAVEKELTRLGLSGITTKNAFKQLVLSLDVSTEAGSAMYAALLNLAPAFQKVVDFTVEGSKDLSKARDDLSKAYEREASALQDTASKFGNFADSLRKFRQSLSTGPNALLSPEAAYNASKAAFTDTAAKARLGDEKALGDLQGVSQAYLDASKAYYASSGNYFKDLEAVKQAVQAAEDTASRTATNAEQQLAALQDSVKGLIDINESVLSVRDAILALQAVQGATATGSTSNGLPPFLGGSGTGGVAGLTSSGVTGASFDPAGYAAKNPDVAAAYDTYLADQATWATSGYGLNDTRNQFLADHYRINGKDEGRSFATGGLHSGGLRLVGEQGPELEATGPSRIWNFDQTRDMLRGSNDNAGLEARLDKVCKAVDELGDRLSYVIVQHGEAVIGSNDAGNRAVANAVRDGKPYLRSHGNGKYSIGYGTTNRLANGGRG